MKQFIQQIKQVFAYNRREKVAVMILVIVAMVLLVVSSFPKLIVKKKAVNFSEFDSLVVALEKGRAKERRTPIEPGSFESTDPDASFLASKLKPFPFNPNMLPEEDWTRIGLSESQIRMIKNYEKKGGKFLRKKDLSKIYAISAAEYAILEPFIVIPDVDEPSRAQPVREKPEPAPVAETKPVPTVVELNTADSVQLMGLRGIGPWYARRIIQYRQQLGGYVDVWQLMEIKGIDSSLLLELKPYLRIDSTQIKRLDLNSGNFRDLLRHPYINYQLTKQIVNHRERKGKFASWDAFIALFPGTPDSITRLKPYVRF